MSLSQDEISLDYLAGFLDGEGSFTIGRVERRTSFPEYSLRVYLANTNKEILKMIQRQYGGSLVRATVVDITHKQCYGLVWCGRNAVRLCEQIKDRLFIKKDQVDIFLSYPFVGSGSKFSSDQIQQREESWKRLRDLNRRGNGVSLSETWRETDVPISG